MFCPECRGEFRPEIYICPDCEVELVSELPEATGPDLSPLVTVYASADLGLIQIARSLLDSAGIPCTVRNERTLSLMPSLWKGGSSQGPLRKAEIQVTARREEEARRLLEDLQADDPPGASGGW